jgi:hypothetical protein
VFDFPQHSSKMKRSRARRRSFARDSRSLINGTRLPLGHNQFYTTSGIVETMDKESTNEKPARIFSKDDTEIAYDKVGRGPAIILVPGALGTRLSWSDLPERLSSIFTVVAYDRRGRGASTDMLPFSLEREIEDIEALIDQVAGGSASLYGISSGGRWPLRQPLNSTERSRSSYYTKFLIQQMMQLISGQASTRAV